MTANSPLSHPARQSRHVAGGGVEGLACVETIIAGKPLANLSRGGAGGTTANAVDTGERISALSAVIQALPAQFRWAAAIESAIAAQATDGTSGEGLRGRKALGVLAAAQRAHLSIALTRGLSLARLAGLWRRQCTLPGRTVAARHIFVGIRALNERFLVPRYEVRIGGAALFADQRQRVCLAEVARPCWAGLHRAWRDAIDPVLEWVAAGDSPIAAPVLLTGLVRRAHEYAYFLAAFRELRDSGMAGPLGFSTADIAAHAAVAAGMEAIYYQHGFLRRSLVFPDFVEVNALNRPEGHYLARRLPGARVCVVPPPATQASRVRRGDALRRLVVAGDYVEQDAEPARELIAACLAQGIEVIARPHPADGNGLWRRWGAVDGVLMDKDGTFGEFLERTRPAAVAAWYSTALYDAVLAGVAPITFERRYADIVFPFQDMAMGWPRRREDVMALFGNAEARDAAVAAARAFAVDGTGEILP